MDDAWRDMCDRLGPARIELVRHAAASLRAIVVVDNVVLGPALGGVRMAADVTASEVARVARATTLRNAAARIPRGGAAAAIIADPRLPHDAKEELVRAFAQAIRGSSDYIPAPDMGTDATCMAWIHDEIGRGSGRPEVLGGMSLDAVGAAGLGLAVAAEVVEAAGRITLPGARVVLQGFGTVGRHAARFLAQRGARVVAVADTGGAVHDPDGLELVQLEAWKVAGNSVASFPGATPIDPDTLIAVDCDIWIPAARAGVITTANAPSVRAAVVLEGASIPATAGAEELLEERGILVVPDVIASAGAAICAFVEHNNGTRAEAFALIDETIRANTTNVLERAARDGITPRSAAEAFAYERLAEGEHYRRHFATRSRPTVTGTFGPGRAAS